VKGAIPRREAAATEAMEATLDRVVMEVDNPTRHLAGYQARNPQILRFTHDSDKEKGCFWKQVDKRRHSRREEHMNWIFMEILWCLHSLASRSDS
jgi:hypothetical protein